MRAEDSWDSLRFHDGLKLTPFGAFSFGIPNKQTFMQDDTHEYRYERRDDEYSLRCWHDGREVSIRGYVHTTPEWLRDILATAKVAGALRQVRQPPPDEILWFRTDPKRNLIEFIETT